mmetsp:Transcript_16933/g.20896  ORF Transcript_16933/g.20896 Transcript_16933/m.20896 type:complete len:375 (-) Transcript_16933:886-2010(-)|eukprot:CAMPEP_0204854974 /NCGR_PEP_ID=MMETSP1347-20130617/15981_1 /ASSEMBLY_ACC=CAM_ASM_000690 /TAXON_ID=215587 /ORGANISM="Aplanochytrium stocchinoi, Strain GSBS06" /LENGTH=374 /DNA_ID=CAMNT_0052000855 /DNA_START=102 /DNA_END=1226 /DNA_ORIENTATION=+
MSGPIGTRYSVVVSEPGKDLHDGISNLHIMAQQFPQLEDTYKLGPKEMVVQIQAATVSYPDLMQTSEKYKPNRQYPFVAGFEFAGVILAIGDQVTEFTRGDAIMGTTKSGTLTTHTVVEEHQCLRLPQGLSYEQGACWSMGYIPAYHALVERAQLTPNEDFVLINDAAGGMGYAAVQIAKLLGCKVIVTSGSDEKLSVLTDTAGADYVINYNKTPKFADIISEITGGAGVDVVFDSIGGLVLEESIKGAAFGARILIVGFSSGQRPNVSTDYILMKCLNIIGCRAFEYVNQIKDGVNNIQGPRINTLISWTNNGFLRPHISHSYPLTQTGAREAYHCLLSRKVIGRVAIRTGPLAQQIPYEIDEKEMKVDVSAL